MDWTNHPFAIWILVLLSFSESAFFIIPPELLLIPMGLANPGLALWYGVATSASSVAGAAFGYGIGKKGGQPVLRRLFSSQKIRTVQQLFQRYDTKAIFISAFTPIPFKVFTIGAGAFELAFNRFLAAATVGRSSRYLLIAGLIAVFGDNIRHFLEEQFDVALLVGSVVVVVAYAGYRLGVPLLMARTLPKGPVDRLLAFFRK